MMVPLGPQSEAQSAEVCFLWVVTEAVWLSVVRQRLWVFHTCLMTYSNYLALHRCGGLKSQRVTLLGCQGSFTKGSGEAFFLFPQPMCPGWGTTLYHGHTMCTHALYLGRWAPVEFVGHLRFTCVAILVQLSLTLCAFMGLWIWW